MVEDTSTITAIESPSAATHSIGIKRSHTPEIEPESKRQRVEPSELPIEKSPTSPKPVKQSDPPDAPVTIEDGSVEVLGEAQEIVEVKVQSREPRRKIDQGQRAKRLFGALLNLNQRTDERKTKQRREIESRKKAELQQQDDKQIEDDQRRLEHLLEWRRERQQEVDRDHMHIRHRNMIHTAHFLQTRAQPRLYYLPWTLRPDEEDQIDDQIAEARAIVERERRRDRRDTSESRQSSDVDDREERFVEQSLRAVESSGKRTPTPDREASAEPKGDLKESSKNDGGDADDSESKPMRSPRNGTAEQEVQNDHELENKSDEKAMQANGSTAASDTGQSQTREAAQAHESHQDEVDMDDADADEDAVIY